MTLLHGAHLAGLRAAELTSRTVIVFYALGARALPDGRQQYLVFAPPDSSPLWSRAVPFTYLRWGSDEVSLLLAYGSDGPVLLLDAGERASLPDPASEPELCARLARRALPLVEVQTTGTGRLGTSGKRHVDGAASRNLRYAGHEEAVDGEGGVRTLYVRMVDESSGLRVTAVNTLRSGVPVLAAEAFVENTGDGPLTLEYVSSFVLSNLARRLDPDEGDHWEDGLSLWLAANPWSGEFRWSRATLAGRGLYDVGMVPFGQTGSKNRIAVTSTGSWSSSEYLPMGCLEQTATGRAVMWQIEHNGSWHAELADRFDDVYLALSGPTDREHQWRRRLAPGDSFCTVPVAVALVPEGGFEAAITALTLHRRATRRVHPDHRQLPIVFNDFMNSLMGEPSTKALLPLVDAAAAVGAEYFCIDAGWYDAEPPGTVGPGGVPRWWDAVGDWEESASRFPGGLGEVLDRIRAVGMVPGLWLEPEVVGVRSAVASALPEAAFFRRDGIRVVEWGRYHLDLRHPAASAHLDTVVDRLVDDYGVGYLKLDYNIDIGPRDQRSGRRRQHRRRSPRAQPGLPRLAGPCPRPPSHPGHRELRGRRQPHRPRHPLPAAHPLGHRPAGLPPAARHRRGRTHRRHPGTGRDLGVPAPGAQ